MTFARVWRCVNSIVATLAHDLLSCALGSRLHVPASFVGTDEVAFALGADPLADGVVVFETFKVCLCGPRRLRFGVDEGQVKVSCRATPWCEWQE